MPYRRGSRPITVSDKHEISWSLLGVDASGVTPVELIDGVQLGVKASASDVGIGSKVFGLYLEFQFSAETVTNTKIVHWEVRVVLPGQVVTVPSSYYQIDRKFIIQRGMEMLPKDVSTVIKRVVFIRMPRVYQRIGEDTRVFFRFIASSAETINACGFCIYKEKS